MKDKLSELLETDKAFSRMSIEKGAAQAYQHFFSKNAVMLPNNNHPKVGIQNIVSFVTMKL